MLDRHIEFETIGDSDLKKSTLATSIRNKSETVRNKYKSNNRSTFFAEFEPKTLKFINRVQSTGAQSRMCIE